MADPPAIDSSALPSGGALPILNYANLQDKQPSRLLAFPRPGHLTPVIAAGTFFAAASIRSTPIWVVTVVTVLATGLWHLFARARARRPATSIALWTDQLLLAQVLAMTGTFEMLTRASRISTTFYWMPYNQTYFLNPQWALEPLRLTWVGLAWFSIAWLFIWRRDRTRRPAA
jgi:hypothetical protein